MNLSLQERTSDVPVNHLLRIEYHKTRSLSVYYYTLLQGLPFSYNECGYLPMAHFFESLNVSNHKKINYINTFIQFFGIGHTHPLKPYHQNRYDGNIVLPIYYKDKNHHISNIENAPNASIQRWLPHLLECLPHLLECLPDHIMVPSINLLTADNTFFEWIEHTPMTEQIELFSILHTLDIDYTEYMTQKNQEEVAIFMT